MRGQRREDLIRARGDGIPHTLMPAQGLVRNQGDGWTWTLDFFVRTVEETAVTGHEDKAETDPFAPYASFATATDRRLRQLPEGLLAGTEALCQAVRGLAAEGCGALRTRVHGDFYLGQVVAWRDSRS